ncbi:hypothetical protein JCM10021v2_006963 [Rhodotorula toruloides]
MLALRLARPSAFRSLLPRLPSAPRLPRATFGTTTRFQPGYTWRMVKREVHEQDLEEAEDVSHLMTLEELDKTLDPAPYRSGAEVKSLKAGQPIELHPMLDDVNFFYIEPTHSSSPGARLEVRTEDCDIVVGNAYSDPAIDELATSPPCARLVVRMQGDLAADISNPEGVTERGFESMYPHFRPDLQVGRLAKGQPVELHPIIDHIEFYCMCSAKNSVGYAELKGYEEYMGFNGNAYEDPAINDLVTSPPCSRMIVRMQGDLAADINNPQGVTVYDVVEGVARYYERPVSDEAAKYWWRKWGGPRYEDEVVTVDDYLPQHCERPNWDRGPEVQEDGSVLLECLRIYGHNEQHR